MFLGDGEIVDDSVCRERAGHPRLPNLVARIRLRKTLLENEPMMPLPL